MLSILPAWSHIQGIASIKAIVFQNPINHVGSNDCLFMFASIPICTVCLNEWVVNFYHVFNVPVIMYKPDEYNIIVYKFNFIVFIKKPILRDCFIFFNVSLIKRNFHYYKIDPGKRPAKLAGSRYPNQAESSWHSSSQNRIAIDDTYAHCPTCTNTTVIVVVVIPSERC